MATPVGHIIGGSAAVLAFGPDWPLNRFRTWVVVVVFANLSDLDFLPGLLAGDSNAYHRMGSHSLMLVAMVSLLSALWLRWRRHPQAGSFTWGIALLLLSHLAVDMLTVDRRPPFGIPLLWPFSDNPFISALRPLADIIKSSEPGSFFSSLFCRHNIYTMLREIAVLLPLWGAAWWARERMRLVKSP